ncbi:MAG: methylisocitrate lyase [Waddliaceae bacterium]
MKENSFRLALKKEQPLQLLGVINPYIALMAEQMGYSALYLSGAGIANFSYGLPDIGITTLGNVIEDAMRIVSRVSLPLIVDIDTGWEIEETIDSMVEIGVAGVHIEDQPKDKRCGHLPGKEVISIEEMTYRITLAKNPQLVLIARTDAYAIEGLEGVIKRGIAYKNAGAEVFFPEALPDLESFERVKKAVKLPILANITEFGKTPLYTLNDLKKSDVDIALYPLSCARAMNKAAETVMKEILEKGETAHLVNQMQTRSELYNYLNYEY